MSQSRTMAQPPQEIHLPKLESIERELQKRGASQITMTVLSGMNQTRYRIVLGNPISLLEKRSIDDKAIARFFSEQCTLLSISGERLDFNGNDGLQHTVRGDGVDVKAI